MEVARSVVFALYSAVGGDEWSLVFETDEDKGTLAVSVRGVSLDVEGARVDLTVDPSAFARRDASDLRALHERIARELPKGAPTQAVSKMAKWGMVGVVLIR
jgi:hypothetical protein